MSILNQIILTSFIAIISAIIGSLVTPWVKWGIEKRKKRFEYRILVLNELKKIADKNEFNRIEFINSPYYQSIRNKFSEQLRKTIERPLNSIIIYTGDNAIYAEKEMILSQIASIEKKWKII